MHSGGLHSGATCKGERPHRPAHLEADCPDARLSSGDLQGRASVGTTSGAGQWAVVGHGKRMGRAPPAPQAALETCQSSTHAPGSGTPYRSVEAFARRFWWRFVFLAIGANTRAHAIRRHIVTDVPTGPGFRPNTAMLVASKKKKIGRFPLTFLFAPRWSTDTPKGIPWGCGGAESR